MKKMYRTLIEFYENRIQELLDLRDLTTDSKERWSLGSEYTECIYKIRYYYKKMGK